MDNLCSSEQELQTRISTGDDPHQLLLLQERHAASRQLNRRLR